MIYLKRCDEPQLMYVPKNGTEASVNMRLIVEDTVDHNEIVFDVLNIDASQRYFRLAVIVPDSAACGEYQYRLMGGEICLSTGLLMVTGEEDSVKQYNRNIKYTQYESE